MRDSFSPYKGLDATRRTLVERLANWDEASKWQEFFDTYWRLFYAMARKAGLNDTEAQDVVQETVITVAKNITKYEREAGSFKGWLLNITRWRIADQFRRREPHERSGPLSKPDTAEAGTATIERIVDPAGEDFEQTWEEEWQRNVLEAAIARVKRKVSARHFQIFDCTARQQWSAARTARELRVNIAQVYLIKHRVAALLKKEVAAMRKVS